MIFCDMKWIFLTVILLYTTALFFPAYSQKQNNSPGSDCFVDVPHTVNILHDSVIPVTVYLHESECIGCLNYLAYVDISLKSPGQSTYSPVLTYNALDSSAFQNMFSEYSYDNPFLQTQSFIDTKPRSTATHTVIFTANTNWWIPPVPVAIIDSRYFYFTFNIPASDWNSHSGEAAIDVKVVVGIDYDIDTELYFRVFTTDQNRPSLPGCYFGDVHYHSLYTQDLAENGMPLVSTKRAAAMLGLDWMVLTDHSCDLDNYGNSMEENWTRLGNEVENLNNDDSSMIFIRGLEASVNNSNNYLVHALVYSNPADPFSLPFVCDGGGDLSSTSVSVTMLLDSLEKYNGFCYAAHPFSEGDRLSAMVNGGIWNVNDSLYPQNDEPCPPIGTVIWNNLSLQSDIYANSSGSLFKNRLIGGELLNLNNYLICSDTDTDPWNTQNNSSPFGFEPVDPSDILAYRFDQNISTYGALLTRGLIAKNNDPMCENWKFFISGGTDAHGSFNYSTTEYVWSGISGRMTENAIGKAYTIAYCPDGMGGNGTNVLRALKNGNTCISTGPVMTLKVVTPNGIIIPGEDEDITSFSPDDVYLEAEAASNNDLGPLAYVDIYAVSAGLGEGIPVSYPISSGLFQISFHDLANDIWGSALPENQYICLRSRLVTEKVFSTEEAFARKKDFLNFFCETNPVWLKVGTLTGVKNTVSNDAKVFPNPVDDMLIITTTADFADPDITLTTTSGKVISVPVSGNDDVFTINTSEIINGYYTVTIKDRHSVARAGVIVLH